MKRLAENSALMMGAQLLMAILGFANRRLFLSFLSIEFLGYESTFGNVLSLLSVADLGMETVIVSKMYKAVVSNDTIEICKLLYIFKWYYRGVSLFVLVCAVAISPFLPFVIHDGSTSWSYLYIVYFMQVAAVVVGYMLSYRRAIFIADQKGGICALCDLSGKILTQILQITVLLISPNYLLYLFCKLCTAPIANILLLFLSFKKYPYTRQKVKASGDDIRGYNLYSESKNYFIHKITSLVFNATDTIIISAICGVVAAAQYSNYYTLIMTVSGILITAPFNAIQAAVGNHLQKQKSKQQQAEELEGFLFIAGIFSIQISLGFSLFSQMAISIWIGEQYLLPASFPVLFSLVRGVITLDYALISYRNPLGNFYKDRSYVICSAFINILLSVVGANLVGINGVLIGTIVGQLVVEYGHSKVVAENILCKSKAKAFMIKQIIGWPLLMSIESIGCVYLLNNSLSEISVGAFATKIAMWCLMGVLNLALLFKTRGQRFARKILIKAIAQFVKRKGYKVEEK